jgi:hypothetical protein
MKSENEKRIPDEMIPDDRSALMVIESGEEIAGLWASEEIPEIGIFKLLAKKRKDGMIEFAHFLLHCTGEVSSIFRGETADPEELQEVLVMIETALLHCSGKTVKMKVPPYGTYSINGIPLDPIPE